MKQLAEWIAALRRAGLAKSPNDSSRLWNASDAAAEMLARRLDDTEGRLLQLAGENVQINPLSGTWSRGARREETQAAAEPVDDALLFEGQLSWMPACDVDTPTGDVAEVSPVTTAAIAELRRRIDRMVIRGDGTAEDFPVDAVLGMHSILTANDREAMTEYERVWRRLCYADGRSSGNRSHPAGLVG